MELKQEFENAVAKSQSLPNQPNDNLLRIYSLYKQATEGDVNIDKPSNPFDIKGNAKYAAWESLKGMSKEEAMKEYIDFVNKLS
ncbi:acyl-CoA-binding protein [Cytophagaceae bacterium ABcell3]|nr:acyl-CoA-binding protein [Cytophagaceae bacterium ABcell3]